MIVLLPFFVAFGAVLLHMFSEPRSKRVPPPIVPLDGKISQDTANKLLWLSIIRATREK